MKHLQLYEGYLRDYQAQDEQRMALHGQIVTLEDQMKTQYEHALQTIKEVVTRYGELKAMRDIRKNPFMGGDEQTYLLRLNNETYGMLRLDLKGSKNLFVAKGKETTCHLLMEYEEVFGVLDVLTELYPEYFEGQEMGFYVKEARRQRPHKDQLALIYKIMDHDPLIYFKTPFSTRLKTQEKVLDSSPRTDDRRRLKTVYLEKLYCEEAYGTSPSRYRIQLVVGKPDVFYADRRDLIVGDLSPKLAQVLCDYLREHYADFLEGDEMGFFLTEASQTKMEALKAQNAEALRKRELFYNWLRTQAPEGAFDLTPFNLTSADLGFTHAKQPWTLTRVEWDPTLKNHHRTRFILTFKDGTTTDKSLENLDRENGNLLIDGILAHYPEFGEATEMGFFVKENHQPKKELEYPSLAVEALCRDYIESQDPTWEKEGWSVFQDDSDYYSHNWNITCGADRFIGGTWQKVQQPVLQLERLDVSAILRDDNAAIPYADQTRLTLWEPYPLLVVGLDGFNLMEDEVYTPEYQRKLITACGQAGYQACEALGFATGIEAEFAGIPEAGEMGFFLKENREGFDVWAQKMDWIEAYLRQYGTGENKTIEVMDHIGDYYVLDFYLSTPAENIMMSSREDNYDDYLTSNLTFVSEAFVSAVLTYLRTRYPEFEEGTEMGFFLGEINI